ncbi:MAG: CPBP family intramembrane glutamic endopeptidase [Chthoniobacter sp.]|uniref:CPBP family intramembrane glutamic endopeptidase n=1 Tax=Chthoniobacter sp. TaxID=2510640 RepID=UPI0032AAAA94
MPVPASTPPEAWLAAGFFLLVSLAIYGAQVRRVMRDGGKVLVDELGLPELLMTFVFAGFFAMLTVSAFQRHGGQEPPANIDALLPSSLLLLIFVAGISGFMRFRGLNLLRTFGLNRVGPLAVLGWAVGLIFAAFPLQVVAQAITLFATHGNVEPQPLVDLFNKVARQHDFSAMSKILVSAVIVAPICEEFLFRGFFYGVWKRYIGPWGAGLLACLLFAAFHAHLPSFAGLFILAVCLNIAYERTGSLVVPIVMHALFNLTSLLVIYAQAQPTAAP